MHAVVIVDTIDRSNVRVIECGQQPRLALEACAPRGVLRKDVREKLDRDMPSEPGVVCPIDITHAARAEERDNFVPIRTAVRAPFAAAHASSRVRRPPPGMFPHRDRR